MLLMTIKIKVGAWGCKSRKGILQIGTTILINKNNERQINLFGAK